MILTYGDDSYIRDTPAIMGLRGRTDRRGSPSRNVQNVSQVARLRLMPMLCRASRGARFGFSTTESRMFMVLRAEPVIPGLGLLRGLIL